MVHILYNGQRFTYSHYWYECQWNIKLSLNCHFFKKEWLDNNLFNKKNNNLEFNLKNVRIKKTQNKIQMIHTESQIYIFDLLIQWCWTCKYPTKILPEACWKPPKALVKVKLAKENVTKF